MTFNFKVYGKPRGKQRPRFTKSGHVYTPKETVNYEREIRTAFLTAGGQPLNGEIKIELIAAFKRPPACKPDVDNILKIVMDALNKIAYDDDKQVVEVVAYKTIAEKEFIDVTISEIVNDF